MNDLSFCVVPRVCQVSRCDFVWFVGNRQCSRGQCSRFAYRSCGTCAYRANRIPSVSRFHSNLGFPENFSNLTFKRLKLRLTRNVSVANSSFPKFSKTRKIGREIAKVSSCFRFLGSQNCAFIRLERLTSLLSTSCHRWQHLVKRRPRSRLKMRSPVSSAGNSVCCFAISDLRNDLR